MEAAVQLFLLPVCHPAHWKYYEPTAQSPVFMYCLLVL